MAIILYGSLHGAAKRYAEHLAYVTGIKAFDYKDIKDLGKYDQLTAESKVVLAAV